VRRIVAVVSVFTVLLLAQAGVAGVVPQVVVSGTESSLGASGDTTVDLRMPGGMTGSLMLFVPPGYSASLDRAPGQPVGSVLSGSGEGEGGDVELAGSLTAADPAAFEESCAPGPHAAVWSLTLWGPGFSALVPVLVDPVGAGTAESSYASYRLEACLGDLQLRALTFRLEGIFANPTRGGAYTWRVVGGPGSPAPEIELRSSVLLPVTLLLSGRYEAANRRAAVRGTLMAAGEPVADASVAVSSSTGTTKRATTDARGRFETTWAIRSATTFRASAEVAVRDMTAAGCTDPIAAGGCVSAVSGPFAAESRAVRVAPPARPVLRLGSRGASVKRLQQDLVALRYLPWGAATGVFDERTSHAVVAFQGWQRHARDGVVRARTWAALEHARVPAAPSGFERGLVVDTSRQVLLLVSNGVVRRAIHVSTAAPGHSTPRGRFRVYRKEVMSWSVPFEAFMPYEIYLYVWFDIQ
jgi:hypothetical protein